MNLKKVENYSSYYISDCGRVFSDKYNQRRELKQRLNKKGYYYVNLCENGNCKSKVVHRIVALHFIENKDGKPYVNHIDANKQNNTVENLEFVTASENSKHAYQKGLITSLNNKDNMGEKNSNAKITKETAIEIKSLILKGIKASEISKMINVSHDIVRGIKRGLSWKHISISS